jgi:hypothetical protein
MKTYGGVEVLDSRQGEENFLYFTASDRLWGPTSFLSNEYRGALFPGVKRPGRGANHSPPSSAEVKNGGPIVITVIFIGKY